MLVLLENHPNFIKDDIFKCFFIDYNRVFFFFCLSTFFHKHKMMGSVSLEEEKMKI